MASSKTPAAKPLPVDALEALQKLCGATTQAAAARRLGVSDAAVSGALKGRYIGNVERLAERIRGELLNAVVECPVLGSITARICQDEREKPFHTANPMRVQIWRACKSCPNNPSNFKGGK
jgi:predicted transcriptional regulator